MENVTYDLGFAIINFETETIVWKAGEFDPKRKQLIEYYFKVGYIKF